MAYGVVKYIICAGFWGTNITAVPLSTNCGGTCPPVIYAHGQSPWSGGQGGEAPLKLRAFSWMYVPRFKQISPFLMFGVKRRKMIFKHRQTTNIRAVMLSLALVVLKDQISVLGPVLGLEA